MNGETDEQQVYAQVVIVLLQTTNTYWFAHTIVGKSFLQCRLENGTNLCLKKISSLAVMTILEILFPVQYVPTSLMQTLNHSV